MRRLVSKILIISIIFSLTSSIVYAYDNMSDISEQYLSIIKMYKTAQDCGFYKEDYDKAEKAGINIELAMTSVNNLHYALVDLAGDGVPELFIANIDNDGSYRIYDTFGYSGGKASRLFDTYSMGYRAIYTIMSDGIIQCLGSGGAFSLALEYYKLNSNSISPVMVQFIEYDGYDGDKYYVGTDNYNNKRAITSAEYDNISASYSYEQNIVWHPIDAFADLTAELMSYKAPTVVLNGTTLDFAQSPVIQNGRTLVPMRAIFEAMGADVDWDGNTRTVTSSKDGTTVVMTIGSNKLFKNGAEIYLDVPAQLIGDYTMVPVRAVAEAFNTNVSWDGNTKTVYISDSDF